MYFKSLAGSQQTLNWLSANSLRLHCAIILNVRCNVIWIQEEISELFSSFLSCSCREMSLPHFFSDALYTFYRCLYFQYSTYAHKCITGERYFVQGVKTYRNCIQMAALANIGFNSYTYWGHEKVIIWDLGVTLLLPVVLLPFNMSVSPRCLDDYQVMIRLKGVSSKHSGNHIVVPNVCLLS